MRRTIAAAPSRTPWRLLAAAVVATLVAVIWFSGAGLTPAHGAALTPHPGLSTTGKTKVGWGWSKYRVSYPGDMNGDGIGDVLAVGKAGELWLYPGRSAAATYGPRIMIGTRAWESMVQVQGADINSDGLADVLAQDRSGRMWLYLNRGDGHLRPRTQIGTGWGSIRTWVAVEVGPGGHPAVYAIRGDDLRVYPSNGRGKFSGHRVIGAGGWDKIREIGNAANMDGGGGSDLLAIDGSGYLRLYSPNSRYTSMSRHLIGWGFSSWRDVGGSVIGGKVRLHGINAGGDFYSWKISYGRPTGSPPPPPKPKPPEANAVFVYGTLRVGQPNHSRLHGTYSSWARTSMSGLALYRMSGYSWPWAVVRSGFTTHGEVYWLKPGSASATVASLDRLEGYNPNLPPTNQSYVRVKRTMGNGFSAWVWVAGPRTAKWMQSSGSVIPSGDWLRR